MGFSTCLLLHLVWLTAPFFLITMAKFAKTLILMYNVTAEDQHHRLREDGVKNVLLRYVLC